MTAHLEVSVSEAMSELSVEATVCRDLMHSWRPHTAYETRDRRKLVGYERVLKCRTCGTERTDKLNTWGGIVGRTYAYPDGYLVKGVGRFSGEYKDAARLANVKRLAREPVSEED